MNSDKAYTAFRSNNNNIESRRIEQKSRETLFAVIVTAVTEAIDNQRP